MPVVYETNADIPSFGGINTTGDGYNMSLRLAREMENVDCTGGGFTQMRQGRMLLQQLSAPIETLEILHRRWGLREDNGVITEQPDWLVAVAGGKVYTKTLDGDDDWALRYEGLTDSRCSCVAYEVNDFDPMEVGDLTARVSDDGKTIIVAKPTVSKGSGTYTLNYILQRYEGGVTAEVFGGVYITDEVSLVCPENGAYRVKAIVSDGTTQQERLTSYFFVSVYEAYGSLQATITSAELNTDGITISCPRPEVTGGYPGENGYTYTYSCFDKNGVNVGVFEDSSEIVWVKTYYNSSFTVTCTVSDGKTSKNVNYGWFEVTAHAKLTELNIGPIIARLSDDQKGIIIRRPLAGGGTGQYFYRYTLNRLSDDNTPEYENSFNSDAEEVAAVTAKNGKYSVQVIVQDMHIYDESGNVILQGGHSSRSASTYWIEITGHDNQITIETPEDKSYPMDVLLLTNAKDGMICLRGDGRVDRVDTPYKFGLIERANERIWGTAITDEPDVIAYSHPYDPMDWKANEEIPEDGGGEIRQPTFDGDSFVALKRYSNYLLAFKKNAVWRIAGTDPSNITFRESRGIGTIAPGSIVSAQDYVWMMTWFGLARYNGSYSHPFQAEATRGFLQDRLTEQAVTSIAAIEHNGSIYMAYPADGSTVNNRMLIYTPMEQAFSLRTDIRVTRFLSYNGRLFYATADAPGCVFEMNNTGHPLPIHWVSGFQDMGIKGSVKSAFTVYFECEAAAKFPLTIGIRTEKKLKKKQLVITPGKAYHKTINVQGRYFRLELDTDTLEPFRINGGIRIHMELDPD